MPLEPDVDYIADFDRTSPGPAEFKSEGDDHLRNIKKAALQTFPGFAGAVAVMGQNGGAANAYTVTSTPALPSYTPGTRVAFSPTVANTGPSTLNISSNGAKPLRRVTGGELMVGDLVVGVTYEAIDIGAEFRLLSLTKNQLDQTAFQSSLPALAPGFLHSDGATALFGPTHTGYAQNEVKGANIASASAINLATATGNLVHVTGTTTISAITIPVGADRTVIFDGALTLVHGAGLLLPGGANIVTEPGDRMVVRGDTDGAVVTSYVRASAQPIAAIPLLHVWHETGSAGGSSVAGTQDRVLNTVVTNTITGASLASNQITLPPGTYDFDISAPAFTIARHRAWLFSVTDGGVVKLGTTEFTGSGDQVQTRSLVRGRFAIVTSKVFKVQHYTDAAVPTQGLGGNGTDPYVGSSVYTEARFWKVA